MTQPCSLGGWTLNVVFETGSLRGLTGLRSARVIHSIDLSEGYHMAASAASKNARINSIEGVHETAA